MSYLNYKTKYPTIIKYKEKQNIFNQKLRDYLALEDEYNKLVQKQLEQAKWSIVPGKLSEVVATGDTSIWGYNASNDVYTCKKPCMSGKWIKTDGKIKDIAGDSKTIYGLGMGNTIWKKPQDNSGTWIKMFTKDFDFITTNNSNSIVGVKKSFNVQLRITVKCAGGKDTDDESVSTSLKNICVQKGGSNLKCQSFDSSLGSDANTSTINFTTTSTRMDKIILDVNNSTHEIEHDAIADLFSGKKVHFNNPFKKEHVNYPYVSYLKIECLQLNGTYKNLYESNLNIQTSSGTNSYGVSLGNGLVIGYNMFQCIKPCDDNNWQPISVDKDIQDISADESYIYMTDSNNLLWRCPGGCSSGNWERDPIGSAKKVDASGKKYLRVIGADNMLWERDKRKWGKEWTPTNKVIKNMSMANNKISFFENEDIEGRLWTVLPNDNMEVALRPPWQKWRSEENLNATVGLENVNQTSTDDWDFIGKFEDYEGCKFASLNADQIYNKITYFNTAYNKTNFKGTCWGNKIGGKFKNTVAKNVTTGYPPYGYTKLGGLRGFKLIEKMRKLNNELITRATELEKITLPNNNIAQSMIVQKTAATNKMKEYIKNLKKDRNSIQKLEKQARDLNAENDDMQLQMTQKQGAYIAMSVITIILLIITIKQMKK